MMGGRRVSFDRREFERAPLPGQLDYSLPNQTMPYRLASMKLTRVRSR
jgi:hypothetical protein